MPQASLRCGGHLKKLIERQALRDAVWGSCHVGIAVSRPKSAAKKMCRLNLRIRLSYSCTQPSVFLPSSLRNDFFTLDCSGSVAIAARYLIKAVLTGNEHVAQICATMRRK
jgi:hypothetical protein